MNTQQSFFIATLLTTLLLPTPMWAAEVSLAERLSGRILLQTESYGRAWYIDPVTKQRFYLQDGVTAFALMQSRGLGITNTDLATIPTAAELSRPSKLATRLAGRILLQVQERGEAWYVSPVDRRRHYLKDGEAAYTLMRTLALGIKNTDLRTIPVTPSQIVHDTTFDDVSYALRRNGAIVESKNENQILPPASMTKLMTALVLLDRAPINWDELITVTAAHLSYPVSLVGSDATSEVDLKIGDVVTRYDFWVAMLVASSNQATIALVDHSGLTRADFVAAMNQKASDLGLTRTVFVEPTGLNAHTVTTANEMAIIAEAAFGRPDILRAATQGGYYIITKNTPNRTIAVIDRNFSLQAFGADAAKTGYLIEAQRCVALKKGNDTVVVMHARSMNERNTILRMLTKEANENF